MNPSGSPALAALAQVVAEGLGDRQVLLLSGDDAGELKLSTEALARCFASRSNVETHTDLPLTGIKLASATPEQDEAYDRRVIEFVAGGAQVAALETRVAHVRLRNL